jgi:hypothetical protein
MIALRVIRAAAAKPTMSSDRLDVGTAIISRQFRDGTGLAMTKADSVAAPF